jgi:hypothetical protein
MTCCEPPVLPGGGMTGMRLGTVGLITGMRLMPAGGVMTPEADGDRGATISGGALSMLGDGA